MRSTLRLMRQPSPFSAHAPLIFVSILTFWTLTAATTANAQFAWQPWRGSLPHNAVIGGQEPGRSLPICRASYRNGQHPGKVVANNCNLGWGGQEIVISSGFDVLVAHGSARARWAGGSRQRLPSNAWPASHYDGKMGYVCRARYNNGVHPGKVVSGNCNIGWGGREIVLAQYDVLLTPSQPAPRPPAPPQLTKASAGSWRQLPGAAYDIGVGGNGQAWVIGTNAAGGGYGIYRWDGDGRGWTGIDGAAVRISVDAAGNPWVVNDRDRIYRRTGGRWQQMSGAAKDIGIGGHAVFVIGTNKSGGGYGIWKWDGMNGWKAYPGAGVRIAVDPQGNPWVVNDRDHIYRWNGGSWQRMPGAAKDIGIGADGTVIVIGTNSASGGYGLWKWNPGSKGWDALTGGATNVAVGRSGQPWVTNSSQRIYRFGR